MLNTALEYTLNMHLQVARLLLNDGVEYGDRYTHLTHFELEKVENNVRLTVTPFHGGNLHFFF